LSDPFQIRQDRQIEDLSVREASRKAPSPSPRGRCLVKTFEETTYPNAAKKVFACKIIKATFEETEGSNITTTPSESVLYVGNIGKVLPPVGTEAVAVQHKSRWLMNYNG
jgi:hypothetical protein